MVSSIRKHFERITAAQAAADSGDQPMQGDAYQLMQATLFEDYRRLKSVQSIERKVEIKREILPNYADYIAGVLEAGQGAQDEVLMTIMLWRIDVGDLAGAMEIGSYALRHDLTPPDRFARSTAAIIAEEIGEQALKQLDDQPDLEALLDVLVNAEALTRDADMHDQIRAKLFKAYGYALRAAGQLEAAKANLERALELNERIGVKKDLEQIERELKAQAEAEKKAEAEAKAEANPTNNDQPTG